MEHRGKIYKELGLKGISAGKSARCLIKCVFFVMLLLIMCPSAYTQKIVQMNVAENICLGDTFLVTFGLWPTNNITFQYPDVTLGHNDTVFLPDGIPCGDMGCSYVSSVTFVDFEDTAYVRDVNDIKYLRINIEHSYIADLYISLHCPNGQKADIMRFGGDTTAVCADEIPDTSRGWIYGTYVYPSSDFGIANNSDYGSGNCVPTPRGIGWNYCWSDNTRSDYTYASGDAVLYHSGHAHNGSIDSSDVAARSNFYHPDQHLSALVGCPMNGEWSVKVMDGFDEDNGYLYSWDLSLGGNLLDYVECPLDSFAILGPGAFRVNDSSFVLTLSSEIEHDTTVRYIFRIFDACGNRYDTSTYVTFRAPQHIYYDREVVENNLPYTFSGMEFYDTVTDFVFPMCEDRFGCDSFTHFTLYVLRNYEIEHDTVVCEDKLPVEWHGILFAYADTVVLNLNTYYGTDSVVTLRFNVQSIDTTDVYAGICNGAPYTWINGISYYDDSEHPTFNIVNDMGCDSILRLNLLYNNDSYKAQVKVSPNPVTDANTRVTLSDVSNSCSREWVFDDHIDTARNCSFVFEYPKDSVEVFFAGRDYYGCTDSTTVVVYSNIFVLWTPNAFTPDEQSNKTFRIFSKHIQSGTVHIFDRSGLYITTFDALTGSWDGKKNGKPCPQGTYIWKMVYTTDFNSETLQHAVGTVTILR